MPTEFDPADFEAKPPHRCALPEPTAFGPRGWRCDCGKAYRRVVESERGETWRAWRRMPEADEVPA